MPPPAHLSPARPAVPEALRGFASVHGRRLELATILPDEARTRAPRIVFLHGAFGSLSSWERFPRDVAAAAGCPVLVYSRAGHGHSDPPATPAGADYLRVEAQSVLPALLDSQGIERPLLVGHEDGAAIALLYAATFDVAGVVALSPRTRVDEPAISAVRDAARQLAEGVPMPSFTRHHRDPAALLARWAAVWGADGFGARGLDTLVGTIAAPVTLLQGEDDEFANLADFALLARALRGRVQSIQLEAVGHAPWQDAPRAVAAAIAALADRAGRGQGGWRSRSDTASA